MSIPLDPYFLSLQSVVNYASKSFRCEIAYKISARVHDLRPVSIRLDPYFLSLQKFNPRVFFSFLAGPDHIVDADSSVFTVSIEVDME